MVLTGTVLILSASGYLGPAGEYVEALLRAHPSTFPVVGALVLGIGITAFIVRIKSQSAVSVSRPDALAMSSASIELRMTPGPDSKAVPYVQFETANRAEREIDAGGRPNKLRFVMPKEQLMVERDLPMTVPIGRRGKLVVKRYTAKGFTLEEHHTHGVTVRVETYFDTPNDSQLVRMPRVWPSMSQRQIFELRNRLAAIPAVIEGRDCRHIEIVREEFPDCADLADDVADAFRTAWADPTILPGKIYGNIKDGIWIVGPRDDPRRPILLSILSEVLGTEYEPISLETTPPVPGLERIDSRMVIRIAIGRKPRRD